MFCPNCGKDCRNARFCPFCGQNVSQKATRQGFEERKKTLHTSTQIYCPNCSSTDFYIKHGGINQKPYRPIAPGPMLYIAPIASFLNFIVNLVLFLAERNRGYRHVCSQCGHVWFPKVEAMHSRYRKCISCLLAENTSKRLEGINGSFLLVNEHQLTICYSEKKQYTVPFEKLAVVDHRESQWPFYGRMSIRDKVRKRKKIPKTFDEAQVDRFTILYAPEYMEEYRQLAFVLKEIIEANRNKA